MGPLALDVPDVRAADVRGVGGADHPTLVLGEGVLRELPSCRARGKHHQAALRALAFKWIRILYRCGVERQPYDEPRYLLSLQKRHAPLLKFAAELAP